MKNLFIILFLVLAIPAFAADQFKINPYTGKLDNAGPIGLYGSGGNVGIGSANPACQLDLGSGSVCVAGVALTGGASGWADGGANVYLTTSTDNVGIGTFNPSTKVQIVGTATATAFVGDGSGLTNLPSSSGAWVDGGTNIYETTTTDVVGIGTTTPAASTTLEIVKQSNFAPLRISSAAAGNGDYLLVNSAGSTLLGSGKSLSIQGTGNLLVGTSTAAGKVNVVSTGSNIANFDGSNSGTGLNNATDIRISNADTTDGNLAGVRFSNGFSNNGPLIGAKFDRGASQYALVMGDAPNSKEWVRILFNGNVGIGTTTPGAKLGVLGNLGVGSAAYAVIGPNTNNGLVVAGNVGIGTWVANNSLIVASGNVGIGTLNAPQSLYVAGTGEFQGFKMTGNGLGAGYVLTSDATGIGTWMPAASGGGSYTNAQAQAATGWVDGGTNVYTSTTTDVVGIGTTTPAASTTLEIVKQSSNAPLKISSAATGAGDYLVMDSIGNVGIGTTKTTLSALTVMNGNVGIGTWNPRSLLDVNNSMRINGNLTFSNISVTGIFMPSGEGMFWGNSNTAAIYGATNGNINDYVTITTNNIRRFNVDFNGNVGIGTLKPGNKLAINGGLGIGTTDSSNFLDILAPSGGLIVEKNVGIGTTTPGGGLVVLNGNVGVGTVSPTSALQVVGTVAATAFSGDGSALTGISAGGWTDGGTNVFTSTTTDNVGIGTTTPNAATLEVVKNAAQPPLKISSTATGAGDFLIVNSAGNIGIGTTNNSFSALSIMNGNVGIGTWKPEVPFIVMSSSGGNVYINGGTLTASSGISSAGSFSLGASNVITSANSSDLQIPNSSTWKTLGLYTNAVRNMDIDVNGNVGIGTTGELAKLTVVGNLGIGTIGTDPYIRTAPPSGGMIVEGNVGIGTWATINKLDLNGGMVIGSSYAGIQTAGSNNLLIQGNVGIGTFATGNPLQVGTGTGTGNVGIGTALPSNALSVVGSMGVGTAAYAGTIGPSNGLAISGNVGIGTTAPLGAFIVMAGNVGIGTWSPTDQLIITQGNVGIGTAQPRNTLQVNGSFQIDNANSVGSVKTQANQACNTTCISACLFGEDTSVIGTIVACTDATADICVCMGPS